MITSDKLFQTLEEANEYGKSLSAQCDWLAFIGAQVIFSDGAISYAAKWRY